MSHILPMTAAELERRLSKVDDLEIHTAVAYDNVIKVAVDYCITNGASIKFKAPVDCTAVSRLSIQYKDADNTTVEKLFAFADANGNDLGNINNLFAKDALVKVILDLDANINGHGAAFVQNADTNAYLESRLDMLDTKAAIQFVIWDEND